MRVPILLLTAVLALPVAAQPARPNIIVILADDLGWGDLGCYPKGEAWGEEAYVPTPNIDRLAASGVRFTQGYATAMVCAPSRAGLLTGQYQQRFGFYAFAETFVGPPSELKLLPQAMREAGYRTGMVGKWHIGSAPETTPLRRGFDRFFGFIGGQHDFFEANIGETLQGVGYASDAYIFDQEQPVTHVKYLTEEFTDRAIDFIAESAKGEKPFFLYLAYNDPHPPNQAPWDDLEPYAQKRPNGKFTTRDIARASIENLDRNIGRLTRWLHDHQLEQRTLVIFSSDNGGSDGGPGNMLQHNGGLRGRKSTFYEGGIRVPFIMSWPGQLAAGSTYDKAVSQLDIYPTALALAKPSKPVETQPLDGVDLLPYLLGQSSSTPHKQLFWSIHAPTHWAVRDEDWKLVLEDMNTATLGKRWHVQEIKLQLFNLADDPNEQNDLAEQHPEIVKRLRQEFDRFVAQSKPSLYTADAKAAHEALLAERAKNPELSAPRSRAGSPGHWLGKRKE